MLFNSMAEAKAYAVGAAFQWRQDVLITLDLLLRKLRVFVGPEDPGMSALKCIPVCTVPRNFVLG
jgi:hypothetical protein